MTPRLFTWPEMFINFVPVAFGVPTAANQAAPCSMMAGTFESVSTLLIRVGPP